MDNSLQFFRGIFNGLAIVAPMWLLIVYAVYLGFNPHG